MVKQILFKMTLILLSALWFFGVCFIKKYIHTKTNWVFSYWVTLLRWTFFLIGAWQLDILVSPLIWELRNEWFYFWFGRITFWDAYALFFWTMAFGFFVIDIIKIIRWLWNEWTN